MKSDDLLDENGNWQQKIYIVDKEWQKQKVQDMVGSNYTPTLELPYAVIVTGKTIQYTYADTLPLEFIVYDGRHDNEQVVEQ